ncbi:hypothetical protein LK994_06790 [Ferruginibacter lapsinanis]|uniref:hypothetical protein n=1 Tax=Ferruginibacter lapsinanis TaxID=563172 RepID=UPI001E41CEF3|nr:hypothetical protein [Ferruginibacter lapsinanis]UEG51180.1 hypothetical protein LK994_06790 [Ferruginibacter lapsinanis]
MSEQQQTLEELQHIKTMMERSSRFISLSGLSGISAGICALIGAWFAGRKINCWLNGDCGLNRLMRESDLQLLNDLIWIALITFAAALISAFFFTYLRSRKNNTPMWGAATIRLFWNTAIPIAVGGLFLIRLMQLGEFELVAPGCLIFYGLALVNASKYTLGEVRYLGYGQLVLGILNLWLIGYGLYFWAIGFGILHIFYGIVMWYKYERQ